jgi:hypothetical protein
MVGQPALHSPNYKEQLMNPDTLVRVIAAGVFLVVLAVLALRRKKAI